MEQDKRLLIAGKTFNREQLDELLLSNPKCDFVSCKFNNVRFNAESDLRVAPDCEFKYCEFDFFNGKGFEANNSKFYDCTFHHCDLSEGHFISAEIYNCNFYKTNLSEGNFTLATFRHSSFNRETDLSAAQFYGAKMDNVSINDCVINQPVEGLYRDYITMSGGTPQETEVERSIIFDKLKIEPLKELNPTQQEDNGRMFEIYKNKLLKECIVPDSDNNIRFLSIEYLCQYPKINPVEMAKSLISNGCKILFDDTSISQVENDKKRKSVYGKSEVYKNIETTPKDKIQTIAEFEKSLNVSPEMRIVEMNYNTAHWQAKDGVTPEQVEALYEHITVNQPMTLERINSIRSDVKKAPITADEYYQNLKNIVYVNRFDFGNENSINIEAIQTALKEVPTEYVLSQMTQEQLDLFASYYEDSIDFAGALKPNLSAADKQLYEAIVNARKNADYSIHQQDEILESKIEPQDELYSGEVKVYFNGDEVYVADKFNSKIILQPAENHSYNTIEEYLIGISKIYPEYSLYIEDHIAELCNDFENLLNVASDEAKTVKLAQLEADMNEGGGYGEDEANLRAETEISKLQQELDNEILESKIELQDESISNKQAPDKTIVAQYREQNKLNVIMQYQNGQYYNHYGYDMAKDISDSIAGSFDSLEEAKEIMLKHRSNAVEINEPANSIEKMNIDISRRSLTKDEFNQLTSEIKDIAKTYQSDPDLLTDYLAFKAQFYQYSPTNAMLIYQQNPNATFVASFTKWKQLGYNIKRGQHHIKISRPIEISKFPREVNGKTVWTDIKYASPEEKAKIADGLLEVQKTTKFIPHQVFDISQTDCPVEDYPKFYNMGHPDLEQQQLYECIKQYAKESGFTVTEEDLSSISLHGYYNPQDDSIHINSLLEDSGRLETMCHELAHGVLHKTSTQPTEIKELEAESFSAMLKRKMGFPVSEESKRYIKQYATKCNSLANAKFDMSKTLDRLSKTFNHVTKGIEETISNMGFKPEREIAQNLSQAKNNAVNVSKISENFIQALS